MSLLIARAAASPWKRECGGVSRVTGDPPPYLLTAEESVPLLEPGFPFCPTGPALVLTESWEHAESEGGIGTLELSFPRRMQSVRLVNTVKYLPSFVPPNSNCCSLSDDL